MILDTSTIDRAIEWLLPLIGTRDEKVINEDNGESLDAVAALCVWCLRLRYNLVEYDKDNIDSKDYPAWQGYRSIASSNIYLAVKEMAKLYHINGGITPDYSGRHHKDISKWTYKRIFGPDVFVPVHVNVEELWRAVKHMFPELVVRHDYIEDKPMISDRIDSNFLAFEINNAALANLLKEI